jgi:transposase InsO family protein
VLNREFTVDAPNKWWVTDITYVKTHEGFLFLAFPLGSKNVPLELTYKPLNASVAYIAI